ncbi:6087_t:CDS:1, partial [Racocetra persica]
MTKYNDHKARHDAITNALKAIKDSSNNSKTPSVKSIARDYGIAETTFRQAIENDDPLPPPGHTKVLTSHEEEQIVG